MRCCVSSVRKTFLRVSFAPVSQPFSDEKGMAPRLSRRDNLDTTGFVLRTFALDFATMKESLARLKGSHESRPRKPAEVHSSFP